VCRATRAGNALLPGLSGGQQRRLSVAVALVKSPAVMFLDEPTSGLDAASAAAVMGLIKQAAIDRNIAVLCTIHQPSFQVFLGFSSVLFMAKGKVAYLGPAAALPGKPPNQ
jgi:ABC-type multidrug transport system ATPase subunit